MRWILLGLILMSSYVRAIPDEILTGYLESHELCVKDAQIRASNHKAFENLKEICRQDYLKRVERDYKPLPKFTDRSVPVRMWTDFVDESQTFPRFRVESKRKYFSDKRAVLGDFYITRDKRFPDRLVLWENGTMIQGYYAIPFTEMLYNAKYINGRIAITGLDSDVTYYAVRKGDIYRMETEFGHIIKMTAALYLADSALIVYDDQIIGIISRKVAEEID